MKTRLLPFHLLLGVLLLSLLSGCAVNGMPRADMPAGMGYSEGQEIYFLHTEVSDPDVARLLTDMMKSPVLLVPQLARVPDASLTNVYVFENGVKGMGPFGFQSDVFDSPPGSSNYSPLRRLVLVSWKDAGKARVLKAASEVLSAETSAELAIKKPGVVVNMPFVTWQGGKR
jgi:hypothetical protein